jgi:hypothetical protein
MAVISPNTFDALRQYVGVRLQQGVPLVDADWNAMEDTRRFEVRAFLKWFVGDGVPDGNDGFRVVGQGVANDFQISQGFTGAVDPVRNVGRCLVDGLDVIIQANLGFRAQPLHASHIGTSAALAAALGVPTIPELPVLDGTLAVYLDVWERIVTPSEDPTLVFAGLGTESCARLKREWVVRSRTGTAAPAPGDPDFLARHSYYLLATVARRAAVPAVDPADVTDRRERRLLVLPSTVIADAFGLGGPGSGVSEYRHGQNRPVISLRQAINSLLRGEQPATPDISISAAPGTDLHRRALFLDATGGLVAVWQSNRAAAQDHVFATRLDLANIAAGFASPPVQLTTGASGFTEPHGVVLPNRDLLVAYGRGAGPNADILMKRAPLAGLAAAAEQPVASTAGTPERTPFLVVTGNLAVLVHHDGTANLWNYRRFRHTDNTFLDAAPQVLSATTTTQRDFHAARHPAGNVWAAFRAGNDVHALELNPATGAVANEVTRDSGLGVDDQPFVLPRANGEVWVFWHSPGGLHLAVFAGGAWSPPQALPNTGAGDRQPGAIEEAGGAVWLVWTRGAPGAGDIFFMRRNPESGAWGQARQMTLSPGDDAAPFALVEPGTNAIWVMWTSDRTGDQDIYAKRLITAV